MPTFEYSATDPSGQTVRGTVLEADLAQAVASLSGRGLKVEQIGPAASFDDPIATPRELPRTEGPTSAPPIQQRTYFATNVAGRVLDRVQLKDLLFFFRQFSTLQKSGVPIVQSLDTLSRQSKDGKMRTVLREMRGHVEAGRPISACMQRYPEVFTPLMLSLVRAGEEGGYLDNACAQLARYLEQEIELRSLYRRVLFMPKLTVFGSIVIILATNAIIDAVAPGGTHIWSPLTQPITWLYVGPIVVGIWLFFRVGLANPAIKYKWDQFTLMVPYLGNTLHQLAMAKFGRAFGALYAGGVPIPRGIELAADACGNEFVRANLYPAAQRMQDGASVFETLRSTGALSPIVLDMVQTGETTGNMDEMLQKMADYYEDETTVRSEQTGRVVGVLAIIAIGIYVCIVLVKFYGSYFSNLMNAANS